MKDCSLTNRGRRKLNEPTLWPNPLSLKDLESHLPVQSVDGSVSRAISAVLQCLKLSAADPDLLRLLILWSKLPDHIHAAINALVAAYEPTSARPSIATAPSNVKVAEGGCNA